MWMIEPHAALVAMGEEMPVRLLRFVCALGLPPARAVCSARCSHLAPTHLSRRQVGFSVRRARGHRRKRER